MTLLTYEPDDSADDLRYSACLAQDTDRLLFVVCKGPDTYLTHKYLQNVVLYELYISNFCGYDSVLAVRKYTAMQRVTVI